MSSTGDPETIEGFCTHHPLAISVLRQHGVMLADPVRTLDACCAEHGLDPGALRAAVTAAEHALTAAWRGRPVPELLDHIVRTYHRPFARELAEVEGALASSADPADPAWAALARELAELRADMEQHMEMEEHVLFPWLRARADTAAAPIRAMQLEHADTIHLLLVIHASAAACCDDDDDVLTARLVQLERWVCEHLHFESNALVPRALRVEIARG